MSTYGGGPGGRGSPASSRSSRRIDGGAPDMTATARQGLLAIGPWQEFALSRLLVQSRAEHAESQAQSTRRQELLDQLDQGYRPEVRPGSAAPRDVSSPGNMSSRTGTSGSVMSSFTDPTSMANPTTALFRRARHLKYKGARYERPWRKPPSGRRGLQEEARRKAAELKAQNMKRMQAMYGMQHQQQHHQQQQDLFRPGVGQQQPPPQHGRRAGEVYISPLAGAHVHGGGAIGNKIASIEAEIQAAVAATDYAAAAKLKEQLDALKAADRQPPPLPLQPRHQNHQYDTHARPLPMAAYSAVPQPSSPAPQSPVATGRRAAALLPSQPSPSALRSPSPSWSLGMGRTTQELPSTPGREGEGEDDDLLAWADGIDLNNVSQNWSP